jgi:dihydrolipoamide dehydrogenase
MGQLTVDTELLIIGSGPGGYVAAIRAAQLGREVLLVERDDKLGGVCLNTGCIPTKAVIHASDFYHTIKEMHEMGIEIKDYSVNIDKMREWKNGVVHKLGSGISGLFKRYGIEVIEGTATFNSDSEVHISGKSDVTTIRFKHCIIATGSSAIEVPGFQYDGHSIISATEILDFREIPKKVVIIGGGYIGTEMGTVLAKLGVDVTIVEAFDRLIPQLDGEIVKVVQDKLFQFGIKTEFNAKAVGYERYDNYLKVKISQNGVEKGIETEKIMVVVGRKPNSSGLGLENTKVQLDQKGFIKVDNQMRTTSPNIYAVGDVVGQPMLAHKASREGKVVAEVISGKNSAFDNKVIPFVVFNDPEIASVGMNEDQARTKGHDIIVGKFPFIASGRALTLNQTDGFVKIIADKTSHVVLGIHAVGPGVSDIISEATLAIEMGATLDDISNTIHPHPTIPESIMEAAEVTLGVGINIFMDKKP